MKLKCLLRGHRWHKMPWLKERQRIDEWFQRPGPDKACLECGKLKYAYDIYIPSPEAPIGPNFEYEGQWLRTHSSYEEYIESYNRGIEKLLGKPRGWMKRPGKTYRAYLDGDTAIFTNEW